MPSRLVESMRKFNEKLDKLESIIQKKNHINPNHTTNKSTHPAQHPLETAPPPLNEPPLRDGDYITYFSCLTPIWTELWTTLNYFDVNASFELISDELEDLSATQEGYKVENWFSVLTIKLDCMLFSADLILKSNTMKILHGGYPWSKTINYELKNYVSKTKDAEQTTLSFARSKRIATSEHCRYINWDTARQTQVAGFVVYDIIHLMASALKDNKIMICRGPFNEAIRSTISNGDVIEKIMHAFGALLDGEIDRQSKFLLNEIQPGFTADETHNPETLRDYVIQFTRP